VVLAILTVTARLMWPPSANEQPGMGALSVEGFSVPGGATSATVGDGKKDSLENP